MLSNDAVDDAVTLTCDSLDRGDDLGATLDALAARASTASGHGAKVVYAAVTELCPEYMPMLDALGDR
ncbi:MULTISPECIES: DUF732 domain-containing protein [unclassified Microbacterium]|uniref:DUF732 domain-containing protein n=1 Tax=unclassified Microbacterium TaxID=2609290 RepID=UPI00301A31AB